MRRPGFRSWTAVLATAVLWAGPARGVGLDDWQPSIPKLVAHVKYLASPELAGRAPGTPGIEKAQKYLADTLRAMGWATLKEAPHYLQPFTYQPRFPQMGEQLLHIEVNGRTLTGVLGKTFLPFPVSANTEVEGAVVFVGYGVMDKRVGYNDYAGVDVEGKIVLMFQHLPAKWEHDRLTPWPTLKAYDSLKAKTKLAVARGAKAVLVVHDYNYHKEGEGDGFEKTLGYMSDGQSSVPVIHIARTFAAALVEAAGKNLWWLQRNIGSTQKPDSFAVPNAVVRMKVDMRREPMAANNIVAWLEGSDPELKHEAVVVGAHFDHLGARPFAASMDPEHLGEFHPGASDNASGVASVLEIASQWAAWPADARPKRSLLVVLFSAEEDGLHGSTHAAAQRYQEVRQVAMVNVAEVGTIESGGFTVWNAKAHPAFPDLLKRALPFPSVLKSQLRTEIAQLADHYAFHKAGIPAIWFTGNGRRFYHMANDTWEHLNYDRLAVLTQVAAKAIVDIANLPPDAFLQP